MVGSSFGQEIQHITAKEKTFVHRILWYEEMIKHLTTVLFSLLRAVPPRINMALIGPFGPVSTDQANRLLECFEIPNFSVGGGRHIRSVFSLISILVLSRDDIEVTANDDTVSSISTATVIECFDVPMKGVVPLRHAIC
jgi:hypothetical protein